MEDPNNAYRTLNFLVQHGKWLPPVVAGATLLVTVGFTIINASPWAIPLGIGVAGFLYLIMCSYVELVRVIVDMLLPK